MLPLIEKFWGTISFIEKKKKHPPPHFPLAICFHSAKRMVARRGLRFSDLPKPTTLF